MNIPIHSEPKIIAGNANLELASGIAKRMMILAESREFKSEIMAASRLM